MKKNSVFVIPGFISEQIGKSSIKSEEIIAETNSDVCFIIDKKTMQHCWIKKNILVMQEVMNNE